LFSIIIFALIYGELTNVFNFDLFLGYIAFFISGFLRAKSFSKLLVSLELEKEISLKDYLLSIYLVLNPIIGIWNIHSRIMHLSKE